jgi:ABC-type nitrate/sulfonate/bicarbonate transport system permease component
VMAGMIAIGMVGIVIDVCIRKLEARLLKHRQT